MRITYPSLLFLALVVTACGGSGGSNPPGTTQGDSTGAKSTGGLIEYYGDSTIWGWKTNSVNDSTGEQVAIPAPTAFARKLPTTPRYEVINEGVSGSTACGLLNGQDSKHPTWEAQMTASKAKWVIMNHGINDRKAYSIAEYKSCLQQLVRTAKEKKKEVILETPNPIVPDSLDAHARTMREVAAEEGVKLIDQYDMLMKYLAGRSASEICPDGLHPKDEIYIMKGEYAAQVFTSLYP